MFLLKVLILILRLTNDKNGSFNSYLMIIQNPAYVDSCHATNLYPLLAIILRLYYLFPREWAKRGKSYHELENALLFYINVHLQSMQKTTGKKRSSKNISYFTICET